MRNELKVWLHSQATPNVALMKTAVGETLLIGMALALWADPWPRGLTPGLIAGQPSVVSLFRLTWTLVTILTVSSKMSLLATNEAIVLILALPTIILSFSLTTYT